MAISYNVAGLTQAGIAYSFRARMALLATVCISVCSCKVTLIPEYDAELSKEISLVAKKVDGFYTLMKVRTTQGTPDREFNHFAEAYAEIQIDLNALCEKNKIRPINDNSAAVCNNINEMWIKYTNQHRDEITINDANIELKRIYMRDAFYAIFVAEEGKKLVTKTVGSK